MAHPVRSLTRFFALASVVAAAACGGDDPAPVAADAGTADAGTTRPPAVASPRCASADEAPFRTDDGGHACTRVGAAAAAAAGEWPDVADAPQPVVYVRPGATGGTGTRDAPLGDLAAALSMSPPPASVLLARGSFALAAPLSVTSGNVLIQGAGSDATVLVPAAGTEALRVGGAGPTVVTLVGLAVRYAAQPPATTSALSLGGAGATLRARDVLLTAPGRGVDASGGATLCAERLSITGAAGKGVVLTGGAHAYLRSALVRGSGSTGVSVSRSHLVLLDSLVSGNGHDGVALVGADVGAACTDDAGCPSGPACEGFLTGVTRARTCAIGLSSVSPGRACVSVDVLERVALLGNAVTGVRAQRTLPDAAELAVEGGAAVFRAPGPVLRAARLVVADTRAPAGGGAGGDGVYVGPGATLDLDVSTAMTGAQTGRMSEVIQSDRVGVLVDGDPPTAADVPNLYRAGSSVAIMGARIASNRGPGIFVQQRSALRSVAFSEVNDNFALGIGATTGATVATLQDNQFISTRLGALTLAGAAAPVTVGDGVSIVSAGSGRALLQDNQFISNERAGLLLAGGAARLAGRNVGSGNRFGVALLAGATVEGTSAEIVGASAPPTDLPYVERSLGSAAGP